MRIVHFEKGVSPELRQMTARAGMAYGARKRISWHSSRTGCGENGRLTIGFYTSLSSGNLRAAPCYQGI
jgi:hypothetical protein